MLSRRNGRLEVNSKFHYWYFWLIYCTFIINVSTNVDYFVVLLAYCPFYCLHINICSCLYFGFGYDFTNKCTKIDAFDIFVNNISTYTIRRYYLSLCPCDFQFSVIYHYNSKRRILNRRWRQSRLFLLELQASNCCQKK